MSYPVYAEMQDSGVEWLRDVPRHWHVQRLKFSCRINPPKSEVTSLPSQLPVSFLPMEKVGTEGELELDITRPLESVLQGFTYFREDDVIVAKITPCFENGKGALCRNLVNSIGFGSTEFHVLRAQSGYSQKFIYYVTRSYPFRSMGTALMQGSAGQKRVQDDFIQDFTTAWPPLSEQQRIAAFLDAKTAEIDELIALKERQVALLQQQRLALISRAVTKGLDPHMPMRDSGIVWLGEVPAEWKVKRLKFVAVIQSGLTLGKDYRGQQTVIRPYLRVANVQDGFLDLENITQIALPASEAGRYELRTGDVLMTEGGDFDKLGRGYVWEGQIQHCLHQNHIFAVRPNQREVLPHFLSYLMTSLHGKNYFTSTAQQTTNLATTNSTKLGDFPLVLPPLTVQQEIIGYLDQETTHINSLVETIQEQIEKLGIYRQALITAAVTGKIDVRGATIQADMEG